jgi:translocation and assembly module TamA
MQAAALLLLQTSAQAAVEITGIEGELLANALAYIGLDEEPCDTAEWRIEQQFRAAPEDIRSALQAYGHYDALVRGELTRTETCFEARFTVAPGEPVRLRNVQVELAGAAAADPAFAEARDQAALRSGEPLHHGRYEQLKRRWSDLARDRGYAGAMFLASTIDVYVEERAADVVLRFDSGPRYRFGRVAFDQEVLTDRLIRSYVPFRSGDPYDTRQLTNLYVALADSGYFESIDIRPGEPDRERLEIPVDVAADGARRRLITYGVGFSTDTGPRLRFGRNNRRYNEQGHQFGINAQLSPVISEFTANYRFPYGDPRTEWINFDVGAQRESTETSESRSLQIGARRVVERPRNWTRTPMVNLLIEDFDVAEQSGRSRLLMPGVEWRRLRADNNIRPSRGSRLDFEVRAAAEQLGSDTSFVQVIASGRWIWSTPRAARFLVRTQLGATGERSFEELPPSVRFFAGGDNSVRGYDFESLGPIDAQGKVVGGSSLLTASFEYEHPLRNRWSLAFFVDSGNAFTGTTLDPKTGAGIGGRWQSPLGPIRVDLAHPLHHETRGWRLHVTLGPDL